jgi:S1/P1 Nuclease
MFGGYSHGGALSFHLETQKTPLPSRRPAVPVHAFWGRGASVQGQGLKRGSLYSRSVAVLLVLTASAPAAAWGPEGHKIVGAIAEARLGPAARDGVDALLKGHSLASISSWADQVRRTRPQTYNWHFVDIPLSSTAYQPERDCHSSPKGDCVVAAINRCVAELRDARVQGPQRVQALMFLVHFVGDIHQPLHVTEGRTASGAKDRGGNLISVDFFRRPGNLHRVWDSGLLEHAGSRQAELVEELSAMARTFPPETFTHASAAAWANATHKEARVHTYAELPRDYASTTAELGEGYEAAELSTLKRQLALAGYRLAIVLEAVFPAQHASAP